MIENFKIAVIGSGTMGNGIAHVAAQSGFETLLVDINEDQLKKALSTIEKNLDRQINKSIISESDKKKKETPSSSVYSIFFSFKNKMQLVQAG